MPRAGKPAASTALPQPAKVNQNVPKNSAPRRRGISIESPLQHSLTRLILERKHRELIVVGKPRATPLQRAPSAEKKNEYQSQQERKDQEASNLVCRLLLEKKKRSAAHGTNGAPRDRTT